MWRNQGHCPTKAAGKRVNVILRNGDEGKSWAADGRQGCRWTLTGDDYDIVAWALAE
jgi:hypothetical protein